MAREFTNGFYNTRAWKELARAYKKYRHGICERCGRPGVIVHHKVYINEQNINDPNVTLNWDNLELLCRECHAREHMGTKVLEDNLMFDENGDLVPLLNKNKK